MIPLLWPWPLTYFKVNLLSVSRSQFWYCLINFVWISCINVLQWPLYMVIHVIILCYVCCFVSMETEYGGLGLDYTYSVAVGEELGNINCGGVPMAIGVQTDMSTPALAKYVLSETISQCWIKQFGNYILTLSFSCPIHFDNIWGKLNLIC